MLQVNTDNLAVVLHRPRFPENIGAAARAAKNMNIRRLLVVEPENCDLTRVLKMATHAAEDVILNMDVYDDLFEALGPFHYVVGTTARTGSHRPSLSDPRQLARHLVAITQENRVALLFGPEDRGLSNHDLKYCHQVVTIPTGPFSSLNLAQAVMVICYEMFRANIDGSPDFVPRLANTFELEGMYRHVEETLVKIHFVHPQDTEYWLKSLRRFFHRMHLQAKEVKIIRGICRQIDWYCGKRMEALEDPGTTREPTPPSGSAG